MVDEQGERRRRAGNANRVPPHNLDAEASLLGALLLSRDAVDAAAEANVIAGDFYKPANQHIYEAIRVLAATGQPVDAVTVAEELRRAGLLDEIGGPATLLSLQATTPAISNAPRYARIVQDTALLRRLIGVASDIAELAYGDPDDVTKALDEAESKMFGIAEHRVTDTTKPIGELLHGAMNDLEAAYERGSAITGTPTGYHDLDELLNGLQPSTLNVVGARPSMGKCVAWDTELLDPATGEVVTAAELHRRGTAGEWVQVASVDQHGHLRVATPSAFVDDGVKPVYLVRTRLGRAIRTTAAHPFLTEQGWRPLDELVEGVRIGTPCRLPWFGTVRVPGAELVLLAHVLGDAGLRRNEEQRRDEAVKRCRDMDVDGVESLHRHGLWHTADEALAIPTAVQRLTREQLLHFLRRLLECNRVVRPGSPEHIAFAARSERLVRGVQHLLLRFGVLTSIHRTERKGRVGYHLEVEEATAVTADADALAVVGSMARTLVATGGVNASADAGHALVHGDVYWDEIVAIESAGYEQVYDLTVPELHNFVAADVFVHNTAFALGLATHVAIESHLPVLFFSLEMGHKELTQRILASEARVDARKLQTGRLTEQDWSKIAKAIGRLEAPLYIDDNPNVTVMEIRAKARRMAARHGKLGLIVIDYLQLMSGRASAENRQVEVSEISRGLKILARELESPVLALSQLSRGLESRADKRPQLSDLRESGCLTAGTLVTRCDTNEEVTLGDLLARGARATPVWTLDEHRRLVPGTMSHVFPSGVKPTFELRLASGRRVEASANHPFLTVDGWRRLDELEPGTLLATAGRLPRPGSRIVDPAVVRTSSSVLLATSRSASATSDVRWDLVLETVPLGRQAVYDATVPGTHNFLANGIVVHNSIEQDADVVMFLYRDEVYNQDTQERGVAEVIVSKHRNGPIGMKRLVFLGQFTRFDNAARGI